jgi:hypothetical protein
MTTCERQVGRKMVGLSACIFSMLILGSSISAYAECKSKNDCKGNRICESGQCVDPRQSESGSSCDIDKDCPGELVCKKRQCVQQSLNDPPNSASKRTDEAAGKFNKEAIEERKRQCEDRKDEAERRASDKDIRCHNRCGDPRATMNPSQWMQCYDRCLDQSEQDDDRIKRNYEQCLRKP